VPGGSSPLVSSSIQTAGYQPVSYATGSVQKQAATTPYSAPSAPGTPAGSTFDINTDPGYQAALAAANRGGADADTALRQGLSNLLIGFGSPSLASQLAQYGYSSNPNDATAAQANYNAGNAVLARLDQTHALNRQGVINSLAAHGLINSGDTGYQLGQQDQQYGQGVYDATQSALNQAYNLQQNDLSAKNTLQQQIASALQSAWQNFMANPGAYAQAPAAPSVDNSGGGGGGAPDISPAATATSLQQTVSQPNAQAIYPATNSTPVAVHVTANRTGGSANRTQGVFSIH